MYIGPHTCMSGYVSAYHGVGKLCILLHTILCHAVCCTTLVGGSDGCCNSTAYMQRYLFLAAAGFAHPHILGLRHSFNLHMGHSIPCQHTYVTVVKSFLYISSVSYPVQ